MGLFKSKGIKEKDVLGINEQRETLISDIKGLIRQEPSDSNKSNMKAWIEMLEDNENGHKSLDEIKVFNQISRLLDYYREHRIKKIEEDDLTIKEINDKASKMIFAEFDSLIYDALLDLSHPQIMDEMVLELAKLSANFSNIESRKDILEYKICKLGEDTVNGLISEEKGRDIFTSKYKPEKRDLNKELDALRYEISKRRDCLGVLGVNAINMTVEEFESQMKQSVEDRFAMMVRKAMEKQEERERKSKKMDIIKKTYYGEEMKLQDSAKKSDEEEWAEIKNRAKIGELNSFQSVNTEKGEITNEQKNG